MSWKTSVPIGVGLFLAAIAVAVVGSAMFLGDKGEEMVHLYADYKKANRTQTPSAPMELLGRWNGLVLGPADGPTAKSLGVGDADQGVVVASVPEGSPARSSGLMVGDVVVGVDGEPVRDLADVYNVSRNKTWQDPALLDVRRHGQALTVFLPAAQVPPGMPPAPEAPEGQWPAAGGLPAGFGAQPNGFAAQPGGFAAQQFYCPQHGLVLPAGSPGVGYACPHCRGPLHLYHNNLQPVR